MRQEQIQTLERIAAADPQGLLRPTAIVEEARSVTSPLHEYFTWDDRVAADQHRVHVARELIRKYQVVVHRDGKKGENVQVSAFVSLPEDRAAGGGYRSIVTVMSDDERRQQLLADVVRRLEAIKEVKLFPELNSVDAAIIAAASALMKKDAA